MSNPILVHSQANIDFVGDYKYPTTAKVMEIGNEDEEIHLIYTSTAVTPTILAAKDGTGFGKAPYGSLIFENLTAAGKIYMKDTAGSFVGIDINTSTP